jgi:hypothetical protein
LKDRAKLLRPVPGGAHIFQRIFTRLGCSGRPPHFVVEYYAYADLTLTIRLREDTAYIRLSDLLHAAPLPVLEAAAAILLARIYRRHVPRAFLETYRRFSYARTTRRRLLAARRQRARRVREAPRGNCHDLGPLYDELNRRYFQRKLRRPRLGWSARTWRTQLGCFDPALNQIVVNRHLDRQDVPAFVVAYVLYHEMLHLEKGLDSMRSQHNAEFRRLERKHPRSREAEDWLKRIAREAR